MVLYNSLMEFLSGNEAIVKGAIKAGARFFAGYPITPASSIMENWAGEAQKNRQLIFLQSEDEIAAIHHLIGAVLTGTIGFTATSGPGFSLMQEGLGLAFTYQAPIVVIDVQRSGPSTGRPTRAGQGEILASRFGSHGDILPFVFYPSSVKDCFQYTVKAFEISWKNKVPVVLLSDGYLSSMRETVSPGDLRVESRIETLGLNGQFTGLVSREETAKRIAALKQIADRKDRFYHLWGKEESETLLIAMGAMARALKCFEDEYQIFVPLRIWPFLDREVAAAAGRKKRVVVVEMNQGQYFREVERVLKRKVEFVSWQEETIDLKRLKQLI